MLRELALRGIRAAAVEGVLVVELKCVKRLANEHTEQSLNYLRASGPAAGDHYAEGCIYSIQQHATAD